MTNTTTTNLTQLLNDYAVTSKGYPALAGLGSHSKGASPVTLASIPAAQLFTNGITEYYTLVLPRGTQYNTTDEMINDGDKITVQKWKIETVDTTDVPMAITTQHKATLSILSFIYPHAEVITQEIDPATKRPRNLSPDEIAGKHVIGVLPPHLIAVANGFTAVSIKDYNYATEKDLSGEELLNRMEIADQAITVVKI